MRRGGVQIWYFSTTRLNSRTPMVGKEASRGLLRPLRGSGFALGQPDSFVAGAFPFRLVLRAMQPQLRCSSVFMFRICLRQRRSGGNFLQLKQNPLRLTPARASASRTRFARGIFVSARDNSPNPVNDVSKTKKSLRFFQTHN